MGRFARAPLTKKVSKERTAPAGLTKLRGLRPTNPGNSGLARALLDRVGGEMAAEASMTGTTSRFQRAVRIAAPLALGALAFAGAAQAQSIGNGGSFNGGYNRAPDAGNSPIDVSMTDINGNLVVVNGQITSAQTGSIFAG